MVALVMHLERRRTMRGRKPEKFGSIGIGVIPARYGGVKRDKIRVKMQVGSAEHG